VSGPVFIALAYYVFSSASAHTLTDTLSPEASAACKMLLFEGVGQMFLAYAAWGDPTRPQSKEFKDDFNGWVRHSQPPLVRVSALWAMGSFFVMVTSGRLELASLAFQGGAAYAQELQYLGAMLGVQITASALLGFVPLLPLVLAVFVVAPVAAGYAQLEAGHTLLAVSQMLYIANFPLAMAKFITRWQGELLNFAGWFVLAFAVTQPQPMLEL
jgi:hypothetical protein